MDLTSDFYRDPKTGQPIRFLIGDNYEFPTGQIRVKYRREIWNTTKDVLITTENLSYVDNAERRQAWFDTPLSLMEAQGLTTFGQVFTSQVLDTILKRANIDPINDLI